MLSHAISFFISSYSICIVLNGFFLYRLCGIFSERKESRWAKVLLFCTLMLSSSMVIWIGDNNFAMTLPFYMLAFLLSTKGSFLGRLTVGAVFFCLIMSVSAMIDTYLIQPNFVKIYDILTRMLRPLVFGIFYLFFHRYLKQGTIKLPYHLWKLCAGLSILPLATLSVLILPAYWMPDSILLHNFNWFQGTVILPIALISSLLLLRSILVLADYETKAQAAAFSEMREIYYQGLKREQTQVRTLRHDLRNHLTAALGFLELGEPEQTRQYLLKLADSQVLNSLCRICENEIVNVVVSSKWEDMKQCGITSDIQIALPSTISITDPDLCALLGNALDNAIEGAQKSTGKHISIRCKSERGLFMLRVSNSIAGNVPTDLSTTKKDKALHGFGLAGMREIATRYGGFLDAGLQGDIFELIVSIPLKEMPDLD